MKITKILTVAALAMASAALLEFHASAQVMGGSDDLILGFDVTSGTGTGATQDYEVDLGPESTYATAGYSNSNITPISLDLAGAYGSGWAGRTDVEWSIVGNNGNETGKTIYASVPTGETPAKQSNNTTAGNIIGTYNNDLLGSASTANNPEATLAFQNNTPGGFTESLSGQSNPYGLSLTSTYPATAVTTTSGTDQSTEMNLWVLGNNAAPVDLGTFTLNGSTGILSFESAQAVPEPSAYALGICAAVLFWVLKRRRSVA